MKFAIAFVFASLNFANANAASTCLDGYYDFGPQAAALGFICGEDQESAQIIYCKRSTLLNAHFCSGKNQPVDCKWNDSDKLWLCEEFGNYPFTAWITEAGDQKVRYKFKSSFNDGELIGTKLKISIDN